MRISVRRRVGAALSALALAVGFGAARPQPVHAAPAYGSGFIAYGGGSGWTVLDPATHTRGWVFPTGAGYHNNTELIWTLRYSPGGGKVAFVASDYPSQTKKLWVAAANGTGAREVATGGSDRIAWTPDGSRILFGVEGIMSVPADGSAPPTSAVPDPCGTNPQVTTQGYIFYDRACGSSPASLAVYRPGDAAPSTVSSTTGVVSRDGTRLARVSPSGPENTTVTVDEIGGNGPGRPLDSYVYTAPVVDFGPSGDLVVSHWVCCRPPEPYEEWDMDIFAISSNTGGSVLTRVPGGRPDFLDWVDGSANLPVRPVADRIGGADRVATAIDASRWAFDTLGTAGRHAAVAVLARDDTYPDALAGTALAVQLGGPLLLTPSKGLDQGVGGELKRVLAPGSTVYVLGGPAALGPGVVNAVRGLGFNPVRLGGADRYATAVAIATAISGPHPKSVLLATGTDFPDALTAGVAAGQERYSLRGTDAPGGGIVLLTDGATMPAATLAYLTSLKPGTVPLYAIGGPAAAAVHSAVPWWPTQIPLVGFDRFDTAAKVATSALFGNGAPGRYTMAAVTTGLNFPDAMSGGALAGSQGAPLLLADTSGLSPAENTVLRAGHLSDIAVVGGPAAVSTSVFTATADTAFGPHTWDAATNRSAPPLR